MDSSIFTENNYSLNEYRDDLNKLMSFKDHLNALKKCVACLLTGYVIKERKEGGVIYTCIKRSNASDYFGFSVMYRDGKIKETTCLKLIKEIENELIRFDEVKLMGSNPRCLNIFRPPTGKYLEGIPEKIISFFETRVYNPIALHEELSSHAYRFRHPNAFIEKMFIHYSPNYGNCGKSLLAGILGLMYPGFANVAVQQQQITNTRFTGWVHDLLMLHIEELQNSNYRNHEFETVVKQITTKNGSGEKKGIDTKANEHHAIVGFNTNQKDLYGLIRADDATISRLVILYFKPKDESLNWDEFKSEIGLNDKCCTLQDSLNLGYSMYYYLKTKYDIKQSFSPCRYYEQEKFDLISKLRNENKNSIDSWLCELKDIDCDDYVPYEYKLLQTKKIKGVEYICIKCTQRDIGNSYIKFMRDTNTCTNTFKPDTIIQALIEKGFTKIKSQGYYWLRIEVEAFEKLRQTHDDDIEEVEFEMD